MAAGEYLLFFAGNELNLLLIRHLGKVGGDFFIRMKITLEIFYTYVGRDETIDFSALTNQMSTLDDHLPHHVSLNVENLQVSKLEFNFQQQTIRNAGVLCYNPGKRCRNGGVHNDH